MNGQPERKQKQRRKEGRKEGRKVSQEERSGQEKRHVGLQIQERKERKWNCILLNLWSSNEQETGSRHLHFI